MKRNELNTGTAQLKWQSHIIQCNRQEVAGFEETQGSRVWTIVFELGCQLTPH